MNKLCFKKKEGLHLVVIIKMLKTKQYQLFCTKNWSTASHVDEAPPWLVSQWKQHHPMLPNGIGSFLPQIPEYCLKVKVVDPGRNQDPATRHVGLCLFIFFVLFYFFVVVTKCTLLLFF